MSEKVDDRLELIESTDVSDIDVSNLVFDPDDVPHWVDRDRHAKRLAAVKIEDGEIVVGEPTWYEGNMRPRWKDNVLFAVRAHMDDKDSARRTLRNRLSKTKQQYEHWQNKPY